MEDGVGDLLDGGGHSVFGVDGADDGGPAFVAAVVLDAYALDVGDDYEILPYLFGQAAVVKLLAEDGVCLAERFKTVAGDGAEATDAEAGAGEGLTVDHGMGKPQCLAYYSDLVLVEELQGLDQLKLQVLGKTAHVVVGFDGLLALCLLDALKDVGVDGALCKIGDTLKLAGLVGKYVYKLCTDDLSLSLGIGNVLEEVEEAIGGVYVDKVGVELITEDLDDVFGFVFAHQAVVDMDTGQLLANCLNQQCGHNRGVHAAGQGQQNLLVTDLTAFLPSACLMLSRMSG